MCGCGLGCSVSVVEDVVTYGAQSLFQIKSRKVICRLSGKHRKLGFRMSWKWYKLVMHIDINAPSVGVSGRHKQMRNEDQIAKMLRLRQRATDSGSLEKPPVMCKFILSWRLAGRLSGA